MTAFLGSVAFAGAGILTGAGTPATSGMTSPGASGVLNAKFSTPIYVARATSQYDSNGVSTNLIDLPVPVEVVPGDFGLILITWVPGSGSPSISATGWTLLVDNSAHASSPFVVLNCIRQADDGESVSIGFSQSLLPTAVAVWYPEIARASQVGAIYSRNGTSSANAVAPSVSVDGAAGGMLVALFAERSSGIGTTATIGNAAPRVFLEGAGASSASALIADSYTRKPGPSGDVTAVYSTPSGNASGVLISLLPVGAVLTGFPSFSAQGSLTAVGAQLLGTPNFGVEGSLSATGRVRARASLGVTGTLTAVPVLHGAVALSASGRISFAMVARGSAALAARGTLSAIGAPRFRGNRSLAALGVLTASGSLRVGIAIGLSASGRTVFTGNHPVAAGAARTNAQGLLVVTGHPHAVASFGLSGSGGTVFKAVLVKTREHIDLRVIGGLNFSSPLLKVRGNATLYSDTETTFVGGANFTERAYLYLSANGSLTAVGGLSQIAPVQFTTQPYYVRAQQSWVIEQERQRHVQALYQVGEPVLFVLMWKVEDYESGLVTKCPRCAEQSDSVEARISAVYQQPQTTHCGFCFGTTFYGGVRAKVRRPALITDADEDERKSQRGVIHNEQVMIQTTDDFRVRTGDYVFRRDGSRWQMGHPQRIMLRTGFGHPTQVDESIGYGQIPASREDRSSVAYEIPPTAEELISILTEPLNVPQTN